MTILSIFLCRLKKLYKGNAYVGLRIPDADTGTRQTIDMVLVTKEYDDFMFNLVFELFKDFCVYVSVKTMQED